MYQNRFSNFEKRENGVSMNTQHTHDSKVKRFNRAHNGEFHRQNNQQKHSQQKLMDQLHQQSLIFSPAVGKQYGFKDPLAAEYCQNRRSEGPTSSIYSLPSPIKHDDPGGKKKKITSDYKMMSPKDQTSKAENEPIYWSRSECDDGKPASGDEQVSFTPTGDAIRIASTLPKNSTIMPTGAGTIWYREKQRPRCKSALGMAAPRENEFGAQVYRDNFGQHYSLQLPKNRIVDKTKPSCLGLPRPNYYRSVQYLPLYRPKEISPFNGSFRIPRPSTISKTFPVPPGPVAFNPIEKSTPPVTISDVSSVTTRF